MRISTWVAGGTCASATAAPARRKRARAIRPIFFGFRVAVIFRPRPFLVRSVLRKAHCGNPALLVIALIDALCCTARICCSARICCAAHAPRATPLSSHVLSVTESVFCDGLGCMDRRHLLKNSLALGGLAGLGVPVARPVLAQSPRVPLMDRPFNLAPI